MKYRDEISNIKLTSYDCYIMLCSLLSNDRGLTSHNNYIRELLIKLWNEASDVDKGKALENEAFIERLVYWEIKEAISQ